MIEVLVTLVAMMKIVERQMLVRGLRTTPEAQASLLLMQLKGKRA